MRARDDLTAPLINFSTASEIQKVLRSCGLYIQRQDKDFQHSLHGKITEDFNPHQFLCTLDPNDEVEISEPTLPYAREDQVLRQIARYL